MEKFTAQLLNENAENNKRNRLIKTSKTRKAKNVIEFDASGQVIRDKLQVLQERPKYKIYPLEQQWEICVFCKGSSRDEELRVKCGPVYGPIKIKGQSAFVHELCGLWTPEIFLDDNNKFRNLGKGIKRCKKLKCNLCREKGGGLGCFIKNCDKTYHYLCAKISNCLFVNSKFIIYCEDHRKQATEEHLEEEKVEEDQDEHLQHYICQICKSGLDEDHIVICDGCDHGYHSNCHKPVIDLELIDDEQEWFQIIRLAQSELNMQKNTTDRSFKQARPAAKKYQFIQEDEYVLRWQPIDSYNQERSYQPPKVQRQEDFDYYEEDKGVSATNQHKNGGRQRLQEQTEDFNQYQNAGTNRGGRGFNSQRGRGRGQVSRGHENITDPGGLQNKPRFAERGRGRGRGANQHQTRGRGFFNGISTGGPGDFQETRQRARGRGQGFLPRTNYTQQVKEDYYNEEVEQASIGEKDENFIDYRQSRQSVEEIFEEKVIIDKRCMQIFTEYKDYNRPEIYQGPQFVLHRERGLKRNHYHEYDEVKFESKIQMRDDAFGKIRKESFSQKTEQIYKRKQVYGQEFDFKKEKATQNKFWKEEKVRQPNEKVKRNFRQKLKTSAKKSSLGRGDSNKEDRYKKGGKQVHFKYADQGPKDRARKGYEEYLTKDQILKGLDNGTLFEGVLRINQNNRRRAFVTANDITVDVMIEGLMQQNRALDGDTVIIELLNPGKWVEYTSGTVVVGKNSVGQKVFASTKVQGYTNETAVETRIVDKKTLVGQSSEDDDAVNELKDIKKDFIRRKSEDKKLESERSDSEKEENSNDESDDDEAVIKESDVIQAIYDAEALEESHDEDQDQDVGYAFIDDEQVISSGDEAPKRATKVKVEAKTKITIKTEKIVKEAKIEVVKKPVREIITRIEGKNKVERVAEINRISKEMRPLGIVKAIIRSPNREKEHLVTLMPLEKELLIEENMLRVYKQSQAKKDATSSGIYAVPVSKKLPWMAIFNIPDEFMNDIKEKKKPSQRYYIVKLDSWKVGQIRPTCNVIKQIGEAGNLDAESLRILKMHDIWSDEYETEGQPINIKVHESLRVFTKDLDPVSGEWQIPEDEIKARIDLRQKRIFTIDPITAKDLDDALSIEKINDTIYEIGVHIADVSYFVIQGTDLDKEAQLRCTSVYFVHKVYPMLPRLLCERLCSLNPSVDRLAYSVFFRMDMRTGEVDRTQPPRIARTVIRSCAKWNYQLVQDILDGKITSENQLEDKYKSTDGHKFNDMRNDCFLMNEIAQKRRKKRLENGSIMLSNREFTFVLDQESKMPMSFDESYRIESKFLVEEYMLLANILVAEHLYQYCKDKTLLRVHPDLDEEKKQKLKVFFEKTGLEEINLTDSKCLSESLEALKDKGDSSKFNVAMRKFLTCLQCAKYMCINQSEANDYQHFGLNFPLYTHFTSPIRRYADLLVHRLVTLTLQHKEATRDLIELMDYSNYAEMCSEKSYNAKKASTQCQRLFHCLMLKNDGVKVFETLLFDMDQGSISIYIDEINMHHKLRLREDYRVDSCIFFEEQLTVVSFLRNKKKYAKNPEVIDEKRKMFKSFTKLEDIQNNFEPDEYLVLKIFDKVKVKVETTTEFPLDIVCTLMFTQEDDEEYQKIINDLEAKESALNAQTVQTAVQETENLDSEV